MKYIDLSLFILILGLAPLSFVLQSCMRNTQAARVFTHDERTWINDCVRRSVDPTHTGIWAVDECITAHDQLVKTVGLP